MPDEFRALFDKMMETFHDHQKKQLRASYFLQDREERKARLDTVIELSVELTRIREISNFSTIFGEAAIEAVIEGDWHRAKQHADDFDFAYQGKEIAAKYGPIWERFRTILQAAVSQAKLREKGLSAKGN